jgi:hypothetical protein
VVLYTYAGYLVTIHQFLLAVLLLLHRPRLRLTQKLGNIRLTENGVQLNIKKNKFAKKFKGYPYYYGLFRRRLV